MYDLPEGIDGNSLSLAPDATVPTDEDLLYSQYDCLTDNSDNYQMESVNQFARVAARPEPSGAGTRVVSKPAARLAGASPAG
jgi:hypothetical protein